jgi:hypothetical protein
MTPEDKLNATLELVRSYVKPFGWVWKSDSKVHRAIGWVFDKLGMEGYMNFFYTTFRYVVGRPNDAKNNGVDNEWQVFLHEAQHSIDAKSLTFPLFALIYGFPQILGLLAVPLAISLVLITHSWLGLLGLLALVLATPIPAIGRTLLELRGYRVSLSTIYWYEGIAAKDEQDRLDEFSQYFNNSSYYWMGSLFKNYVKKKFQYYLNELKAGRGYDSKYLSDVRGLSLGFAKSD